MQKLHTLMILEILGKPAEHVFESLNQLVDKLDSERGVKITKREIRDPLPVENSKELFTTFAELEVEFETLDIYLAVLFAYMPANVEIISPENMTVTNTYLNDLGNKVIQRMHNYDAITKKTLFENQVILQKIRELAPDVFKKLTKQPDQNSQVENVEENNKPQKSKKKK